MWFHRDVRCAGDRERLLEDHLGVVKSFLAEPRLETEPVTHVSAVRPQGVRVVEALVQCRSRLAGRFLRLEHSRQLPVLHLDQLERLLRFARRRCRDGRDHIAHVQDAVARHDRLVLDHRSVQRFEVGNVIPRETDHRRGNGVGVDGQDHRVRMRRTQNPRVQHSVHLLVLRVPDGARYSRIERHAESASRPRRTSTAITWLRYAAEPRTSESVGVSSEYRRATSAATAGVMRPPTACAQASGNS